MKYGFNFFLCGKDYFVDGYHFHDRQMFKSPDSERFTVSELVEAWDACKKV